MTNSITFIYDGSFNGFLSCIFAAYDQRIQVQDIQPKFRRQEGLFSESQEIPTELEKAKRVWLGLKKKNSNTLNDIYFAFLSEAHGVEMLLYRVIQKCLSGGPRAGANYSDPDILQLHQLARKVGREKHRMEAFVRFMQTKDGIYFANVAPDFNVLPLISKHFRLRYADQEWLIYDLKRKFGLHYDLHRTQIVALELDKECANSIHKDERFTEEENEWQELWKNYFRSTNIRSRINTKLHLQHVPKRYHRYLVEKNELRAAG